jgi:hypothetical protein
MNKTIAAATNFVQTQDIVRLFWAPKDWELNSNCWPAMTYVKLKR